MNHPYFEPNRAASENGSPVFGSGELELSQRHNAAEAYLTLGNRHYNNFLARAQRRDLDTAIEHFRRALETDPTMPEAYVKMASALWDKGEIPLETAIAYCESSVQLNPDYAEGYLFLGYFQRRAGRLEEAEARFRLAIQKSGALGTAKARMALGRLMITKARLGFEMPAARRITLTGRGVGEFLAGCCLLPTDRTAFRALQDALLTDIQIFGITGTARLLKTAGLRGAAMGLYERAAASLPQEPLFFHLLGDMHCDKGGVDAAIYFYNRAQELDPDNALLAKKLGRLYNRCNDSANAAKSLQIAVDAEESDFDSQYLLAQVYLDRGEYMRALFNLKELLRETPDNPYLHSNMGYLLFKLEDYEGAVQAYRSAVSFGQDPVWTATVAQTLGTIHYQIEEDLDAAAEMFQMAHRLDPANLDCLTMLGDIYTEQGHYEMAMQTYRFIIEQEPDNADCHNYLGYLLWQLDKNDEAVAAYRRAIELNPNNPVAYNNLGVIFLDEKCQLQSALNMFETAFKLKPDYTLACFNVARTREAMGRVSEAAHGYTDALALNRINPEIAEGEIQARLEQMFQA